MIVSRRSFRPDGLGRPSTELVRLILQAKRRTNSATSVPAAEAPDLARRRRRAATPSEAQALEIGTSPDLAQEILHKQEGADEKAGRHRQA